MPAKESIEQPLKDILFKNTDLNTYAIVNGAGSDKILMNLVAWEPEHRILYSEYEAEELEEAAPWLVKLNLEEPYTEWLLEECYGERLLLFFQSIEDIYTLATHFQDYTKIGFPDGQGDWQPGYFSFYDPGIFKAWVSSLTEEEIPEFHKPVNNFWFESEKKEELHGLSLKDNSLVHASFILNPDSRIETAAESD